MTIVNTFDNIDILQEGSVNDKFAANFTKIRRQSIILAIWDHRAQNRPQRQFFFNSTYWETVYKLR